MRRPYQHTAYSVSDLYGCNSSIRIDYLFYSNNRSEGARQSPAPLAVISVQLDYQPGHGGIFETRRKPRRAAAIEAQKLIHGHIELRNRYEQEYNQAQAGFTPSPQVSPLPSPPQSEQCTPMECAVNDTDTLDILASVAIERRTSDVTSCSPVQRFVPRGLPSPPTTIMDLDSPLCSPEKWAPECTALSAPFWTPPASPYTPPESSISKSKKHFLKTYIIVDEGPTSLLDNIDEPICHLNDTDSGDLQALYAPGLISPRCLLFKPRITKFVHIFVPIYVC